MGAFFTNVQVRVAHGAARARLLEGLRRAALAAGFVEAGDDVAPDRVVLVGPVEAGWATLCDELTESQDPRALDELASAASAAVGGHAVSVLVHDSDVLQLALFEGGRPIDRFDSAPGYFGRVDADARRRAAGDPERWQPLLANGTVGDLRAIWSDRELHPEGVLAGTADLLGIERARTRLGYRHFAANEDGGVAFDALRFRLGERPQYERELDGPPRFSSHAGTSAVDDAVVGATLELTATAENHGGATKGIEIAIWGDALERGLLRIERMERYGLRGTTPFREPAPLEPAADRPGGLRAVVDWEVAAGRTIPPEDWMRFDREKLFALKHASEVSILLHARALAVGTGSLEIRFTPLAAPRGRRTREVKIRVRDRKRGAR